LEVLWHETERFIIDVWESNNSESNVAKLLTAGNFSRVGRFSKLLHEIMVKAISYETCLEISLKFKIH
jgi:hypothetical protein